MRRRRSLLRPRQRDRLAPASAPGRLTAISRTQVGIVGAGPAGLVLGQLLARAGIDAVVLEARSRDYIEQRVRAGVLEHGTVELLRDLGVADRLDREALTHRGVQLAFEGRRHRVDFEDLVGKSITVYGQQELVKDLVAARIADGLPLLFEVDDVTVAALDSDTPVVGYVHEGEAHELQCEVVAGCDGFHGVTRPAVEHHLQRFEHEYPFCWLGILAEAAPTTEELIYSNHDRGFALYSMRSPQVTRLYLQVAPDEQLEAWSDDRIWDELATRLPTADGFDLREGPVLDKSITAMRSFVVSPMRIGRLFLAGDAAHIVPATGAKGMNLAIADVAVLAQVLERFFATGSTSMFDAYTPLCEQRVWRVQHFSWWMTSMMHRFADHDDFQRRVQLSELAYVTSSRAAATALAENYVGLPIASLEDA